MAGKIIVLDSDIKMKYLLVLVFTFAVCNAAVQTSKIGRLRALGRLFPTKIVGGQEITIQDAPYQIALEYHGSLRCGGTIVNKNHIVTAAHCVEGISASSLKVRSGTDQLESGGTLHTVTKSEYNSNYDSYTIDYDVAVLVIEPSITFGPTRRALNITSTEPRGGDIATISGWGAEHSGDFGLPEQLRSVDVPVVARAECNEAYDGEITERMICAGLERGGKDSCQGDSGGPFVVNGQLAGIVSWGYGCAEPGYPGVYSNVNNLRDWILQRI